MEQRRITRVLEAIAAEGPAPLIERWCTVATGLLDAAGAGAALVLGDAVLQTVHAQGLARTTDGLQADLGEGPAFAAHRTGRPVLVEDLAEATDWPAFAPAAVRADVGSVFAFPLRSGAVRLGAATFCRPDRSELTPDQHADALILARFALDLVLAVQSGRGADDLDQLFVDGAGSSAEIHQATGIVAVQLGVAVDAALAVLRARAYVDRRPLRALAREVVARELHFDDRP
jgi:GAF domain-containing protein